MASVKKEQAMIYNDQHWTLELVEKEKARIETELDDVSGGDCSKRLHYALTRIREIENTTENHELLSSYLYCISALTVHNRSGGLNTIEVNQLFATAHRIVDSQNLHPSLLKIRFLYGELYLVRSQIFHKEGRHWDSTWDQRMPRRQKVGASQSAARSLP